MGEEATYVVNDVNRAIGKTIDDLKKSGSSHEDPRVKAIILTNLEQAQLWSLKLINPQ
jgi:hypothetical protein